MNEWFASWFDTHYYHLLYKDRDLDEAQMFIHTLMKHLRLQKGSKVLDLACGKGRHSLILCELGMDVLGVDLSEQSINEAKKLEQDGLHFMVHDMRNSLDKNRFDAIFNLFTSFGYFQDDLENENVFKVVHGMLRLDGIFVFDFMNTEKVLLNLVPKEKKKINDVRFLIERTYDGKFIRKSIDIDDHGKTFHFEEKVRAYSQQNLLEMLERAGFQILETFGSFQLEPFDKTSSDRAVFICKRKIDL